MDSVLPLPTSPKKPKVQDPPPKNPEVEDESEGPTPKKPKVENESEEPTPKKPKDEDESESEDEDESELDEFEKLCRKYRREEIESEGFDIETSLDVVVAKAKALFGVIRKLNLDANDAFSLIGKFKCIMALKYVVKTENLTLENIIKANYQSTSNYLITFQAKHEDTLESKVYQTEVHFNCLTGKTTVLLCRQRKVQQLTVQEKENSWGADVPIFPNLPAPGATRLVKINPPYTDHEECLIWSVCHLCIRYAIVQEGQKQETRFRFCKAIESKYWADMPKISFWSTFIAEDALTDIRKSFETEVILDTTNFELEVSKITETGKV